MEKFKVLQRTDSLKTIEAKVKNVRFFLANAVASLIVKMLKSCMFSSHIQMTNNVGRSLNSHILWTTYFYLIISMQIFHFKSEETSATSYR